jgi:hypothetical protein
MRDPRDERGQVLVETAIAFPIQLLITLAIMQYCLIAIAKQVVNYAAHAAARAVVVGQDPDRAAAIVCSPIAGAPCGAGALQPIYVPGWGNLPRSSQAQFKTTVARPFLNPPDDGDKKITVEVTHNFELIIPFVNSTPFGDWHPIWGRIVKLDGVVHLPLTQRVTLAQPWDGDMEGMTGHEIIPDVSSDTSGGN